MLRLCRVMSVTFLLELAKKSFEIWDHRNLKSSGIIFGLRGARPALPPYDSIVNRSGNSWRERSDCGRMGTDSKTTEDQLRLKQIERLFQPLPNPVRLFPTPNAEIQQISTQHQTDIE